MNNFADFAGLLKSERKRLGLSQSDAAEKCSVSREIWGKYERGVVVPGGEVLHAFAKAGADVQYVLTGIRSNLGLSALERLFLERLNSSTPTQQDAALRVLLGEQPVGPKFNIKGKVGNQFNTEKIEGGDFTVNMGKKGK